MINEKRNVSVCAPIFRSLAHFFAELFLFYFSLVWSAGIGLVSVQHIIITCNVQALSGSMSYRSIFFFFSFSLFSRFFHFCLFSRLFHHVRIRSGGRILMPANISFKIAFRYVRNCFVWCSFWTGSEFIHSVANIHCDFTRQTITISFTFFGINYANFLFHCSSFRTCGVSCGEVGIRCRWTENTIYTRQRFARLFCVAFRRVCTVCNWQTM